MLNTFLVVPKKQEIVAQSIATAEFIAPTTPRQLSCMDKENFMRSWVGMNEGTNICVGNKAATAISHNPIFHRKTMHFNVTLYFLREVQEMV